MARTDRHKDFERMYIERMNLLNQIVKERSQFSIPFGSKIIRGLIGMVVKGVAGFIAGLVPGNGNHEKTWNFFAEKGFSDAAIAGIMGNLEVESGHDPTIKQIGGGPGRGLLQWTESDRWQGVIKYANQNGVDEWALETQLNFLYEVEMAPSSIYVNNDIHKLQGMSFEQFKQIGDYKKATEVFENVWERAGKPHYDRRYAEAKKFLDKFGGKGGGLGSGKAKQIVDICKYWMERPNEFRLGAGRKNSEIRAGRFDSASFIHRVFFEANVEIGELSDISEKELLRYGVEIGLDDLRTGDIVFFDTHMTYALAAIYIGSGRCIGAFPGEGIRMKSIESGPWKQRLSAKHRRVME